MYDSVIHLRHKSFYENFELGEDCETDGLESLHFIIFSFGPNWHDQKKREEKVTQIREKWEFLVY